MRCCKDQLNGKWKQQKTGETQPVIRDLKKKKNRFGGVEATNERDNGSS